MPVKDCFWGERYGILQDPFGHKWSVATRNETYRRKISTTARKPTLNLPSTGNSAQKRNSTMKPH